MLDVINKESKKEGRQGILLLDEVPIQYNGYEINSLLSKLNAINVDVNIAISPKSGACKYPYELKYVADEKNYIERLTFKHRNTFEISRLLMHSKIHVNTIKENPAKALSDEGDVPIEESCFKSGENPTWILVLDESISDEYILEIIKRQNHNTKVTLLNNFGNLNRLDNLVDYCYDENEWEIRHTNEMEGSEAPVVVLFDIKSLSLEDLSRANSKLIIVTR